MKERIAKLIDIKSIVTLVVTAVFAYLSVAGNIQPSEFVTIFMMIVAFYFGTQAKKNEKNENTPG
ncbi:hypothetical protein [Thermoclostridium caenicola]|uniref:Phage exported protein n=1 Tax=Thermoclostridium caenicola TaxID=659425 RepID=A0A1M6KD51_9FIRM|nr:hypothetical protein [Thermoclostridium caenicola]SHJ56848.1 hypothetical protein SAMN05444373_10751 [Thermoclostridium caenicola]